MNSALPTGGPCPQPEKADSSAQVRGTGAILLRTCLGFGHGVLLLIGTGVVSALLFLRLRETGVGAWLLTSAWLPSGATLLFGRAEYRRGDRAHAAGILAAGFAALVLAWAIAGTVVVRG